jgi:hypothetical protein
VSPRRAIALAWLALGDELREQLEIASTKRPTVRTKGVLRELQNVHGSVEQNSPANLPIFGSAAVAGCAGSSDSPRERRRSSELCALQNSSLCRPSLKRLMGLEPTTFCMAIV